jgi:hypothetical protein
MVNPFYSLRTRLHFITALILLAGWGSAVLIYLAAENSPDTVLAFENSRMYRHDLELYGGKANIIADDFRRWFAGLWQGETLAFTVACITIVMSFGFFFVAGRLSSGLKSGAP